MRGAAGVRATASTWGWCGVACRPVYNGPWGPLLVNLKPGDRLIAAARVVESDEGGEAGEEIPEA